VRRKDGKEHRSWSVAASQRLSRQRIVQRHVLYLGEINDSQRAAWEKVARMLAIYRLLSPGREWRLPRHWFGTTALAERPWQQVRASLRVKWLPQDGELYLLAHSGARTGKERGMRQQRLKLYWKWQAELAVQECSRDERLQKLGAARDRVGRVCVAQTEPMK
jgi:hypothetical protein